jgi:hypothetical protein
MTLFPLFDTIPIIGHLQTLAFISYFAKVDIVGAKAINAERHMTLYGIHPDKKHISGLPIDSF